MGKYSLHSTSANGTKKIIYKHKNYQLVRKWNSFEWLVGNQATGPILRRLVNTTLGSNATVPKSGWTVLGKDGRWVEDTTIIVDIYKGRFIY